MIPDTRVLLHLGKCSSPLDPLDSGSKNTLSSLEGSSEECCCLRSWNGYHHMGKGPCQSPGTIPTEMEEGVRHTLDGCQPLNSWNVMGILLNTTHAGWICALGPT